MTWQVNDDVWVERGEDDFVRHLNHVQAPYADSSSSNPYEVAIDYLRATADELGLSEQQISWLQRNPVPGVSEEEGPTNRDNQGPQLRWRARRNLRNDETIVLVVQQTHDIPLRVRITMPGLPPMEGTIPVHLDIYGAGLRIVLRKQSDQRLVVSGVTSTLRHNFDFDHAVALSESGRPFEIPLPGTRAAKRLEFGKLNISTLLGLALPGIFKDLGLADSSPAERAMWIYRYDPQADARTPRHWPRRHNMGGMVPNSDYPVIIARHEPYFIDHKERVGLDSAALDIVIRAGDNAVLAAIPLMAGVAKTGKTAAPPRLPPAWIFPNDPIAMTGDFGLRPNQRSDALKIARRTVTLPVDPPSKSRPRFKLRGDHVVVLDHTERNQPTLGYGGQGLDPPSEPPGRPFKYAVRTNDFAAVNAYWHLDSMFRRVDMFGLRFGTHGPVRKFAEKAEALHRAAIRPGPGGDGRCVNAQLRIRPGISDGTPAQALHRVEFRFALADVSLRPGEPQTYDKSGAARPRHQASYPLGIACDVRWIWHEFGHALIAGATGDLELRFAHSVGDALAAINCDPDSVLADHPKHGDKFRGVTFPWVNLPLRRHDRDAALGWSWAGIGRVEGYAHDTGDVGGYRREQVLSSTLFRLYRAAGGDATNGRDEPDEARRRKTADYVTYLVARALASLGPAATIPAVDASVFASALMDADCATLDFTYPGLPPAPIGQKRVGGALHKVVRWAFEKQGLYSHGSGPSAMIGKPPPVDVFVDHAGGEYEYRKDWHVDQTEIWSRHKPDGKQGHESVRAGQDNYVYVRIRNRGHKPAFDTSAIVRRAVSTSNLSWPDTSAWQDIPTGAPGDAVSPVPPGGSVVLGPFVWKPSRRGTYTILADVNAPGDRSNINPATGLPCAVAGAPKTRLSRLVRYDNNLAAIEWRVT